MTFIFQWQLTNAKGYAKSVFEVPACDRVQQGMTLAVRQYSEPGQTTLFPGLHAA